VTRALKQQVVEHEQLIRDLQRELEDEQHTHLLRDMATTVLKEEIQEAQRKQLRSAIDVEYLKIILVTSASEVVYVYACLS